MLAGMMLGVAAEEKPTLTETTIFTNGAEYPVFRIPAIVRANDGTLLAFCEGRASTSDSGNIDLVLKRSADNGLTWGPLILVHEEGGNAPITIGNPAPVVDRSTGHIHLLFCRQNDRVFHTVSTDNGLTWAARTEITSRVKRPAWGWYATGPVHGIQLEHGAQAGRLVVPANHRVGKGGSDSGDFGAQILYSDDHGATWYMDAVFEAANGAAPNETTLVEVMPAATDGGSRVYINSRDYGSSPGNRSEAWSEDGGTSYSVPYAGNSHFVTPICQASLLRFSTTDDAGNSKNRIVFSSPNSSRRDNGSLWVSADEAQSWSQPKALRVGNYAYSDMVQTSDGQLGVMFETGDTAASSTIKFIRANAAWIDAPPPAAENPGAAFWNLEETASGENVSTAPRAILDVEPAANDLHLTATTAFPAVAGAPAFGNGRALAFDGSGGLGISDPESKNRFDYGADDSFTIEVVCRVPSGSTANAALVAKDLASNSPSWWLRLEKGKPRFLVSDNTRESHLIAATAINDDQWHHIAAVRDVADPANRQLRIYIDGELAAETTDTTGSLANPQALWIGRFNATGNFLTGAVDFVRITPNALSPADFSGKKSQYDADDDGIPDDFERETTGGLSQLDPGDFDNDSRSDLLEFATGTNPNISDTSTQGIFYGKTFVEVFTHQRQLPDWLSLHLVVSDNLTEWQDAESVTTLRKLNEEIWLRTDRVESPLGAPKRNFFRYEVRETL